MISITFYIYPITFNICNIIFASVLSISLEFHLSFRT
nr:MAG TPA: hypothetical protein [Caudoviricetes sp.]